MNQAVDTENDIERAPAATPEPLTAQWELDRLLKSRQSCRAFTPDPVAHETLWRILTMAQRTASWCNAQPWTSYVLSGQSLTQLKDALATHILGGASEEPDLQPPLDYTAERRDRRRQAGFALYGALEIDKSDLEGRQRQMMKNFEFFGAPHVVVVTTAAELQEYGAVDAGAYMATMMLAAESMGVASCPQAAPALFAPSIRASLDIPDGERIVATVALGYKDTEARANAFRTPRASLEENVRFRN